MLRESDLMKEFGQVYEMIWPLSASDGDDDDEDEIYSVIKEGSPVPPPAPPPVFHHAQGRGRGHPPPQPILRLSWFQGDDDQDRVLPRPFPRPRWSNRKVTFGECQQELYFLHFETAFISGRSKISIQRYYCMHILNRYWRQFKHAYD